MKTNLNRRTKEHMKDIEMRGTHMGTRQNPLTHKNYHRRLSPAVVRVKVADISSSHCPGGWNADHRNHPLHSSFLWV